MQTFTLSLIGPLKKAINQKKKESTKYFVDFEVDTGGMLDIRIKGCIAILNKKTKKVSFFMGKQKTEAGVPYTLVSFKEQATSDEFLKQARTLCTNAINDKNTVNQSAPTKKWSISKDKVAQEKIAPPAPKVDIQEYKEKETKKIDDKLSELEKFIANYRR